MKTSFHQLIVQALLAAGLSITSTGHELVRNGDFSEVLHGWGLHPSLIGTTLPYNAERAAVNLSPELANWQVFQEGPVIHQPLHVAVTPGMQLQISLELQSIHEWNSATGATVAVHLDFLDAEGMRMPTKILHAPNAGITSTAWSSFSQAATVPPGAERLVEISIHKEGTGQYYARNISLTAPVAGGPTPELARVQPADIAYGETFTITGQHFGVTPGTVTIGGTTDGVTITSWSDTMIACTLGDPSAGGAVRVEAGGVRTWQHRPVRVKSPHYIISAQPTSIMITTPYPALPGEPVPVAVFARFLNGFTVEDGVTLSFSQPGMGTFHPAVINGEGGTIATIQTTGWAPGVHEVEILATDGLHQTRRATFEIDIQNVASVNMRYFRYDVMNQFVPLQGALIEKQGAYSLEVTYADPDGNPIEGNGISPVGISSSSPHTVEVYIEDGMWGEKMLLVHDSAANVDVSATLPDGRMFTTTFNVVIPTTPRFVSAGFTYPIMSNLPGMDLDPQENQNTFLFNTSSSPSSISVSYSGGFDSAGFVGSGENQGFRFFVKPNTDPGKHLFRASATVGGQSLSTSRSLTVVNDPATGLLSGRVVTLGAGGHGHGLYGTLEFYDDSTGDLSEGRFIGSWNALDSFTASRVAPGAYRLRWIPEADGLGMPPTPRWYPNAAAFEDAATVHVVAGSSRFGIDFFLLPEDVLQIPPAMAIAPVHNAAEGTFTLHLVSDGASRYLLEQSGTMKENTWQVVAEGWGWDDPVILQDPNASGSMGFYRVRRE